MQMKTLFLKTTLFAAFLLGCSIASAQVSYEYDNAGNRVSRTITLTKSAVVTNDTLPKPATEMLDGLQVKIYPNPTKGQLNVSLSGLADNETGTISIYALNGQLILKENASSSLTELNISEQPTGTYIMKIIVGKKSTTWKIIKE